MPRILQEGALSKKRVYEMHFGETRFELQVDEVNCGFLEVWVKDGNAWVGKKTSVNRETLDRLCLLFTSARDDQR